MRTIYALSFIFFLLLTNCGINTAGNGNGGATETVNAQITINDSTISVTITSQREILADVILLSDSFNPLEKTVYNYSSNQLYKDTTVVFIIDSGKYNMFIMDRLSDKSLAVTNIISHTNYTYTSSDSLAKGGRIQGTVFLNNRPAHDSVNVFLLGTPYCTTTDSSGTFFMENVPRGTFHIQALNSNWKRDQNGTVGRSVEVNSSAITDNVNLYFSY